MPDCGQLPRGLRVPSTPPFWPPFALPSLSAATFSRTASGYNELSPRWILRVLSKSPVERIPDLRLSRYLKNRIRGGQDYFGRIMWLVSQWSISLWETVRNSVQRQKSVRGRSKVRLEVKDTLWEGHRGMTLVRDSMTVSPRDLSDMI